MALVADFEKRFPGGTTIHAAFSQPGEGFFSTVLFGPSGGGKTTILRCLAGLEQPDRGTIRLGERVWFDGDRGICLPPHRRGIGFMFQEFALFPHLSVARNIGYGLGLMSRRARRRRVQSLMQMLDLGGLEARYPHQLSAGQQQRVALARAVAPKPRLLLLDEPLSALDAPTRQRLRHELRSALADLKTPAIVVTHDPLEAIALADQAVVISDGQVRQRGPVHEVFSRPADPNVARIVGVETIEPGTVIGIQEGLAQVRIGATELTALAADISAGPVYVCIRGEEVTLERGEPTQTSARNRLAGLVSMLQPEGATLRVTLDCGFRLTALVTRPAAEQLGLANGLAVSASIKASAIHLVPRSEGGGTSCPSC